MFLPTFLPSFPNFTLPPCFLLATYSSVLFPQIRVAALQNLVKIMSLYYSYMETYMGPALFAISLEAMKSDIDEVQLQGIEFWSNVCDEEVDLAIEAADVRFSFPSYSFFFFF